MDLFGPKRPQTSKTSKNLCTPWIPSEALPMHFAGMFQNVSRCWSFERPWKLWIQHVSTFTANAGRYPNRRRAVLKYFPELMQNILKKQLQGRDQGSENLWLSCNPYMNIKSTWTTSCQQLVVRCQLMWGGNPRVGKPNPACLQLDVYKPETSILQNQIIFCLVSRFFQTTFRNNKTIYSNQIPSPI